MTVWGIARNGDRLLLGEPAEVVLNRDRDAPADLLRVKIAADVMWPELREVELLKEGELFFRGIVDEQNTRLTADGLTAELVCRSLEALLIDNEAMPGIWGAPSLELIEARLLAPLGLSLGEGNRARLPGELSVEKGESCWTVLEDFCTERLNAVPYVDAEGRVQCGGLPAETLRLDEVLSAQVSLLPCKRVNEVWLQSCRGGYDTPYRGREGVLRRRYLSAQSGKDPRNVIAAGERDSFLLTVTCAGARWPGRNTLASVTVPGAGRFERCPVRSVQVRRDKNGEQTRFVLERGEEELPCG